MDSHCVCKIKKNFYVEKMGVFLKGKEMDPPQKYLLLKWTNT